MQSVRFVVESLKQTNSFGRIIMSANLVAPRTRATWQWRRLKVITTLRWQRARRGDSARARRPQPCCRVGRRAPSSPLLRHLLSAFVTLSNNMLCTVRVVVTCYDCSVLTHTVLRILY